jgi:hypothetical protein
MLEWEQLLLAPRYPPLRSFGVAVQRGGACNTCESATND